MWAPAVGLAANDLRAGEQAQAPAIPRAGEERDGATEVGATYDAAFEGGLGREDFLGVTHDIEQRLGREISPK